MVSNPLHPRLIHLTPPGRGAVATIRVEGPGALAAVARHFAARSGRPLDAFPPERIVVGQFDPGGEEVVVRPASPELVELHCHGGLAATNRIEELLVAAGCLKLAWQDWAAEQETDPIAAAARIDLAAARTARTAAILLDQHHGALRKVIADIESSLAAGQPQIARQQAAALLAHATTGAHLIHPWQVVVAGQPNVGKSSLLNAIAGFQRAIVHATPGTTRDVLSVETAVDGWPVEVFDTAGLRTAGDAIEREGIELARRKLHAADLVVLVFDASLGWTADDDALLAAYPSALRVHNKSDLPPGEGRRPDGLQISAAHQTGIDALCREIAGRLVPQPPSPGAAVPFRPEHLAMIENLFIDRP